MQRRIDRMDKPLTQPRKAPGGGWVYPGIIAHPGVYKYRRADGTMRRELVLPEDLHCAESLESLERAPLTVQHVPGDVVDLHNADYVVVGDVANVRADVEGTYGEIAVRTAQGLSFIERTRKSKGRVGLSPVYDMPKYAATPGVHPVYGPYDARQGPRIYNSVALVDNPRGVNAHLRLDSEDAIIEDDTVDPNAKKPEDEQSPNDPAAQPAGEKTPTDPAAKPEGEGDPAAKPEGEAPEMEGEENEGSAPAAPAAPALPTLSPEMLLLKESIIAELRGMFVGHMDSMNKSVMDACKPALDGFGAHAASLGGYVSRFDSMFGRRADSQDVSPEVAYYNERTRLEAIADSLGLPESVRNENLTEFKRNLVKAHRPNANIRADASDDFFEGVLAGLDCNPKVAPRRADSQDVSAPAIDTGGYLKGLGKN